MKRTGRRVLLLHRGGESLRGMEVCAISAARAFVDAGYDLYVLRNAGVMVGGLDARVDSLRR